MVETVEFVCECGLPRVRIEGREVGTCLGCAAYAAIESAFGFIDWPTFESLLLHADRRLEPLLVEAAYQRDVIDTNTLARALASTWSSNEFPDRSLEWGSWQEMFLVAGYAVDGARANRPSRPIRLYRAASEEHRAGHSWTRDLSVAKSFLTLGYRDQFEPKLWTALVSENRLLAEINEDRPGETQFVVDTDGLEITEVSPEYHGAGNE
jgi:hypothetical protein